MPERSPGAPVPMLRQAPGFQSLSEHRSTQATGVDDRCQKFVRAFPVHAGDRRRPELKDPRQPPAPIPWALEMAQSHQPTRQLMGVAPLRFSRTPPPVRADRFESSLLCAFEDLLF